MACGGCRSGRRRSRARDRHPPQANLAGAFGPRQVNRPSSAPAQCESEVTRSLIRTWSPLCAMNAPGLSPGRVRFAMPVRKHRTVAGRTPPLCPKQGRYGWSLAQISSDWVSIVSLGQTQHIRLRSFFGWSSAPSHGSISAAVRGADSVRAASGQRLSIESGTHSSDSTRLSHPSSQLAAGGLDEQRSNLYTASVDRVDPEPPRNRSGPALGLVPADGLSSALVVSEL